MVIDRPDRELVLVPPTEDVLAKAMLEAIAAGHRDVFIVGDDVERRAALMKVAIAAGGRPNEWAGERSLNASDGPAVHVLLDAEGPALTRRLSGYLDLPCGRIIAMITDHAASRRSVFAISPPKAGTHLLFGLLKACGFRIGYSIPDEPLPGHWYYLEYTNAHTSARDFFIDSVRRGVFGNRLHPFSRFPSLLIYRHPLDVAVSESRYYPREGNTSFWGYLSALDDESRLLRLIDDPWLLGSIRDRTGAFVAWLDFPSVIPLSFEELVGPSGGGSETEQQDALWSVQLKLHVPGTPRALASTLFDRKSPTFAEGRIGAFQTAMSERCWSRFRALPQDFMTAFGYDETPTMPNRRHEFRRRPLELSEVTHANATAVVDANYLDHVIVRQGGKYRAVRRGHDFDEPTWVIEAPTLPELQFRIAHRHLDL